MRLDDSVLLIRIARTYRPGMSGDAMYEATRKWWVLNPDRAPDVAFAVHSGTVRGVYQIDDWEQDPRSGRWAFRGRSDAKLEAKYVGRDVSKYFPQGAANPIRYVNC